MSCLSPAPSYLLHHLLAFKLVYYTLHVHPLTMEYFSHSRLNRHRFPVRREGAICTGLPTSWWIRRASYVSTTLSPTSKSLRTVCCVFYVVNLGCQYPFFSLSLEVDWRTRVLSHYVDHWLLISESQEPWTINKLVHCKENKQKVEARQRLGPGWWLSNGTWEPSWRSQLLYNGNS